MLFSENKIRKTASLAKPLPGWFIGKFIKVYWKIYKGLLEWLKLFVDVI